MQGMREDAGKLKADAEEARQEAGDKIGDLVLHYRMHM